MAFGLYLDHDEVVDDVDNVVDDGDHNGSSDDDASESAGDDEEADDDGEEDVDEDDEEQNQDDGLSFIGCSPRLINTVAILSILESWQHSCVIGDGEKPADA